MPNIDGGHYFLTALIPLKLEPVKRADGSVTAPSHLLRETLATLPTAQQSPAAVNAGFVSPFARCKRTHLARFVVIDQPMYNGRDGDNSLKQALRNVNLLAHQPVDALSRPWLLFAADLDADESEPDGGLASWARGLWERTEKELRAIFTPCVGFDAVQDAAGFAAWLKRCQIDTLMSFNDYYVPTATLKGWTLKSIAGLLLGVAVGLLLLGALFGIHGWWWLPWAVIALLGGAVAAGLTLWNSGKKPFPTGANTDLPSVLKALFVQQRFALLAAELQGADADTIHRRFGDFISQVKPADTHEPTQPPGVIRSDGIPLVDYARVEAGGQA
ncbi:hypothetical protein [Sandaracinobacteroides saxicola]|uniref:Uncharacterized protein n=1 Tax=Sandaracinobacteroides saxicola TaxID=2759707 RepID=A0A7G5IEF6_9SPHN|nr:hypothetical protein [Sandaracinobacteroides saxicola]QMW21748.1 hypothetical protein H3309_10065 [Sandaracinobacteroides saxicola]